MSAHEPSALHDPTRVSAARRRGEVAAAGHRGEADVARRHLEDEDPGVRASALGALHRSGALFGSDLEGGLSDPEASVRRRAAELAARIGKDQSDEKDSEDERDGEGLAGLLVGALRDPDASVVEAACFALGELGDPSAVTALVGVAAGHGEPLCRESAVAALGAIGDPAGLAAVLAATGDRPAIRRRAVIALAAFEGPEVDDALARARSDRDWQVRQAAEDLTGSRPAPR